MSLALAKLLSRKGSNFAKLLSGKKVDQATKLLDKTYEKMYQEASASNIYKGEAGRMSALLDRNIPNKKTVEDSVSYMNNKSKFLDQSIKNKQSRADSLRKLQLKAARNTNNARIGTGIASGLSTGALLNLILEGDDE